MRRGEKKERGKEAEAGNQWRHEFPGSCAGFCCSSSISSSSGRVAGRSPRLSLSLSLSLSPLLRRTPCATVLAFTALALPSMISRLRARASEARARALSPDTGLPYSPSVFSFTRCTPASSSCLRPSLPHSVSISAAAAAAVASASVPEQHLRGATAATEGLQLRQRERGLIS